MRLTKLEKIDIQEILNRRANEVNGFKNDYTRNQDYYGSVELALTREIERLRGLAIKINPNKGN